MRYNTGIQTQEEQYQLFFLLCYSFRIYIQCVCVYICTLYIQGIVLHNTDLSGGMMVLLTNNVITELSLNTCFLVCHHLFISVCFTLKLAKRVIACPVPQ